MRNKMLYIACLLLLSGCANSESNLATDTTNISSEAVSSEPTTVEATEETTTEETIEETTTKETTKETTEETTEEPTTEEPTTEFDGEPSEYGWGYVPKDAEDVPDLKESFTAENFPRINGSTATIPLSEAIYSYTTGLSRDDARGSIVHTKTSASYKDLINNDCDILVVYEPSEEIIELLKDNPVYMKPIGIDALVFMENADNPVTSLTTNQLKSIYTGDITNWSEVGGKDAELLAFQRPASSGSQTLLEKYIMQGAEMSSAPNATVFYGMADIIEAMLQYNGINNTLGYSVYYYANSMFYYPELKFVAVDGVMPSSETIYSGEYKLRNPFYAVIRADEPEDSNAHKLFEWLTTDTAQQLIIDEGYVPAIMPENAIFPEIPQKAPGNVEFVNPKPLTDGQFFVLYKQNNEANGDVLVYDKNWNLVMTFYDAAPIFTGVIETQYLPIKQYVIHADDEMACTFGIFDLVNKDYSFFSKDNSFITFDTKRNLYMLFHTIPDTDEYTHQIIDVFGNVLFEQPSDYSIMPSINDTYIATYYDSVTDTESYYEYDLSFNPIEPVIYKGNIYDYMDYNNFYGYSEYEEDTSVRVEYKTNDIYDLYINDKLYCTAFNIWKSTIDDKKSLVELQDRSRSSSGDEVFTNIALFIENGQIIKTLTNNVDYYRTSKSYVFAYVNNYIYLYDSSGDLILTTLIADE